MKNNSLRCDFCGRFLRAEYTAECDFDYQMAQQAGFDIHITQDLSVDTSHPQLAQCLYTLDAGYCHNCEELSIHFAGKRYYWNTETRAFNGVRDVE